MNNLNVSIEQARALDALAREGTFARAAKALSKGHTAVLYALRTLEEATDLVLLDRSAYRTRLTPAGERVLSGCRKLLEAERSLSAIVSEVKTGWEPRLRIVLDGVYPAEPLLRAVGALGRAGAPTRIEVLSEFLSGVEGAFSRVDADLMVSVLPVGLRDLTATPLASIAADLVAHRRHPLARLERATVSDLHDHVLITVRGSDPRLELPTAGLEPRGTVLLNDFWAKKAAILAGLGYGWLPRHLVADELEKRTLVRVPFISGSSHKFRPRLYRRASYEPGKAGERVIAALTGK